jgi:signal transduction histidine kinase
MIDSNLKNARILVVDDLQSNIDVLQDFFEMQGYTNVKSTIDSRDVVDLLIEFEPDLILLDLQMPLMSGFEVMEQLKSIVPPSTYLPILVLTADVTIETKRKALQFGASDFLTKPFDLIELQLRVNTHLLIKYKNQQINEYANELEKLIATKDKFFSIIAHDVRNPFIGIVNYIKILLKVGNFKVEDVEGNLRTIYSTASQGHELLENLLKWSRTQTGTMEINLEVIDLNALVNNCCSLFQTQADNKGIELIHSISDEMSVNTDQVMLETILRNLLSNAIKFTPTSGTVTVNVRSTNDSVEISIVDTGIGISDGDKAKLFRIDGKMQSKKGTDQETGSGLGLILCKELIDKLDSSIWVESEVGNGTTFRFVLPCSKT